MAGDAGYVWTMRQLSFVMARSAGGNENRDEHAETLSTYFYDLPTTAKRRNVYIHPSNKPGSLRIVGLPELVEGSGLSSEPGAFMYPRVHHTWLQWNVKYSVHFIAVTEQVPITMYVIADMETPEGIQLVKEALSSLVGAIVASSDFHRILMPLHTPDSRLS